MTAYTGTNPDALNPVFEQLVRNLTPGQTPVLRIGGDSTDRTWWPVRGMARPGGVTYSLTPRWASVTAALARALHARLVLGINLKANNTTLARHEAEQLAHRIGARRIEALELGNEPELYGMFPWYRVGGHAVKAQAARLQPGRLRARLCADGERPAAAPARRPGFRPAGVERLCAEPDQRGATAEAGDAPPLRDARLLHLPDVASSTTRSRICSRHSRPRGWRRPSPPTRTFPSRCASMSWAASTVAGRAASATPSPRPSGPSTRCSSSPRSASEGSTSTPSPALAMSRSRSSTPAAPGARQSSRSTTGC